MKGVTESQKDICLQLIILSSFGIPIELEKHGSAVMINREVWNLPSSMQSVPLLEILCQYNLYIEKSPSDNQWRIIFPAIVIDQIVLDDRLPFVWTTFSKTAIGRAWTRKPLMETMARCLELSLMISLGFTPSSETYEARFPFLGNSLVGKVKITALDKVKPTRRFPTTGSEGTEQFGKPPSDRHAALQEYIRQPLDNSTTEFKYHLEDCQILLQIVEPNVLYIPFGKSASVDIVQFPSPEHVIHWKCNETKANLTLKLLVEEAQKVAHGSPFKDNKKLTMVMVHLSVPTENFDQYQLEFIQHQGKSLSLRFGPGTKFSEPKWTVPANMDIVLLKDGLNKLLNKHNVAFFKNVREVTLESALAAKLAKRQLKKGKSKSKKK